MGAGLTLTSLWTIPSKSAPSPHEFTSVQGFAPQTHWEVGKDVANIDHSQHDTIRQAWQGWVLSFWRQCTSCQEFKRVRPLS